MQRCPEKSCCRAGDDIGGCGNTTTPCPTPVEVNPKTDVVIRCERCDKTRSADARDLMSGRVRIGAECPTDSGSCQARIVNAAPRGK